MNDPLRRLILAQSSGAGPSAIPCCPACGSITHRSGRDHRRCSQGWCKTISVIRIAEGYPYVFWKVNRG